MLNDAKRKRGREPVPRNKKMQRKMNKGCEGRGGRREMQEKPLVGGRLCWRKEEEMLDDTKRRGALLKEGRERYYLYISHDRMMKSGQSDLWNAVYILAAEESSWLVNAHITRSNRVICVRSARGRWSVILTRNSLSSNSGFLLHLVKTFLDSEPVARLTKYWTYGDWFRVSEQRRDELREGYEGNPPASNGLREPEGQHVGGYDSLGVSGLRW
jgi:hypothetical protein